MLYPPSEAEFCLILEASGYLFGAEIDQKSTKKPPGERERVVDAFRVHLPEAFSGLFGPKRALWGPRRAREDLPGGLLEPKRSRNGPKMEEKASFLVCLVFRHFSATFSAVFWIAESRFFETPMKRNAGFSCSCAVRFGSFFPTFLVSKIDENRPKSEKKRPESRKKRPRGRGERPEGVRRASRAPEIGKSADFGRKLAENGK